MPASTAVKSAASSGSAPGAVTPPRYPPLTNMLKLTTESTAIAAHPRQNAPLNRCARRPTRFTVSGSGWGGEGGNRSLLDELAPAVA